jgi:signal transduction histidine kinase
LKLKIKLPLLFLLLFVMMVVSVALFIRTFVGVEIPEWLKPSSGPMHMHWVLFLFILTGIMFVILTVYFHFNITKPIHILNARLKSIKIGHSHTSLNSKRKDEIGELYNHFNEMEERLQQEHKEKIDMVAAIAHDLKTPLTTIIGFVELLAMHRNLSEKEIEENYALILKKSKHIAELINGFSAFTKDELELETLNRKPFEALKLFENIAAEYETELSGLDYELKWEHSFNSIQRIMINEHMIRRVFGNLFSNAVRYGDQKDLKVYMSGYTHGQFAYIQLEDNGKGVPDKDLSSLFLKFFTVDKSRQSKSGGTGLGLASCKSIIEHHGGEISAFHSDYGGLGIRFNLPLVM